MRGGGFWSEGCENYDLHSHPAPRLRLKNELDAFLLQLLVVCWLCYFSPGFAAFLLALRTKTFLFQIDSQLFFDHTWSYCYVWVFSFAFLKCWSPHISLNRVALFSHFTHISLAKNSTPKTHKMWQNSSNCNISLKAIHWNKSKTEIFWNYLHTWEKSLHRNANEVLEAEREI